MTTAFQDLFSREIWEVTYKDHKDTDINFTLSRIAKAIASVEETPELRKLWEERFRELLDNFKGVPGGRIMSNAGTDWAGTTLMNCFVGPREKNDIDSIEGIYSHLLSQSQTLKSEGGWGENFSYIRPRGSFIYGIGVETPGAVKYMELFDKASEIITAGSGKKSLNKSTKGKIRKGAMMGVMDVWHPDIIEFITAKQQPGRLTKFNVSVNCTDDFMTRLSEITNLTKELADQSDPVKIEDITQKINSLDKWELMFPVTTHEKYKEEWNGDIRAWIAAGNPVKIHNTTSVRWLWNLIMESTYNRAEPGVLFLDRANYFNPLNYAETISATNPCVTADTWVNTANGPRQVFELLHHHNKLLVNGEKYDSTNFFYTGHKDVFELKGKHGFSVKLTADHKVLVCRNNDEMWVEAKDIVNGDKIIIHNHSNNSWDGFGDTGSGYLMGLAVGDGWISGEKVTLSVFNKGTNTNTGIQTVLDRVKEIHSIQNNSTPAEWWFSEERNEYRYYSQYMNSLAKQLGLSTCKTIGPLVEKTSSSFYKGFLSGLFDADGTVLGNVAGGASVRLWQADINLLKSVQRMLQRLGILSTIYENRQLAAEKIMPDGNGGQKSYMCVDQHELSITKESLVKFNNIVGFTDSTKSEKLKAIIASYKNGPYSDRFEDEFLSLTPMGTDDVYDVSVPGVNAFDANGLYVHNCGEQTLSPGNICCLGTVNLTQFVMPEVSSFDFDAIKKYVGYMVRFLDNVNSYSSAPLPEYIDSMRKKRRIGLGVMGWGSALLMLKTRFASPVASDLREKLMQIVARSAYETSIDLAVEKGMFEYCNPSQHANAPFIQQLGLSDEYMNKLRTTGIRNASLMSQQPNGNSSIFANVVSGGIEPVFMPEYVRTVILSVAPEEIISVTPKWYEGEWKETDLFKFAVEGDEQILKGTHKGVTYKIDKSRGLTKEVLCEDYGVRFLKKSGEWDPAAEWAVTTTNLTVDDHVSDLEGFARWTDAACSKTCNIPFNYPYDEFKDLYLKVYNTGFIKGFTTYRSGTMTTVLSAVEEKHATPDDEEIILSTVQLPASAPASMKTLRAEGRKWYLTVVWNEQHNRPFALFVHTNHHEKNITTSNAVEKLVELAVKKGIPQIHIDEVAGKISGDDNASKIARMVSLNLRHGVLIKNIVATLDTMEDVYVGSFLFQIKKFLASYIKDGEKVQDEACLECGSTSVVYEEGCKKCVNCGSSKCG